MSQTHSVFALSDRISPEAIDELYSNEGTKTEIITYFNGLGGGMDWANAQLNAYGKPEIYCVPKNQVFTGEDFYSVYRAEYLRQKNFWNSQEFQPPGLLLLRGMINMYPC